MKNQKKSFYVLSVFVRYLMQFKYTYFTIVFLFFIAGVSINLAPYYVGKLTGAIASYQDDSNLIWYYALLFIGCNLLHFVTWHIAEWLYAFRLHGKLFDFENWIFRQVIGRDYEFYVTRFTGKISSYVTALSREFREFVMISVYNYLQQIIFIPILLLTLLTVNTETAIVFFASIALMILSAYKTLPIVLKYEGQATDVGGTVSGVIFDAFANFVNVKAFKSEPHETKLLNINQKENAKVNVKSFKSILIFWACPSIIVRVIVWPLTTIMNVHLFLVGAIDLAGFSTFIACLMLYASVIWNSIFDFSELSKRLARANEALDYLFNGTEYVHPSSKIIKAEVVPHTFNDNIEIKGLTFSYPDASSKEVIKNLNLVIKKGEKIGIVGRSGSGKTTLIKLLLGYYEPNSGGIYLDNEKISKGELLAYLTYVPQDTTLFNRTLRENIAYNIEEELNTEDKLIEASRKALAYDFIETLEKKFETVVGERGIKLSSGQRQRIAIARALMRDKPIIILDEATSALDSESELHIQKALENMWQGRTVLAIAYRLSTLRNMDRLIVFSDGQLVESGTHEELVSKKGIYAGLWAKQSGGMLGE